jgi:iron complex outermembrane receptor protein
LNWIAGAYYLHDDAGYPNAILRGSAFGFPESTPTDQALDLRDNVDTRSVAGFGQGTVKLLPNLNITAGARYTKDTRIFSGGVYFTPAVPMDGDDPACVSAPYACPTSANSPGAQHSWDLNAYRASIDYHVTEKAMVYFAFNQGAKSGEYDTFGTAISGPVADPPVSPEKLRAYELGMKSEWNDRHLKINVAAFHYDAANLQLATIVAGNTKLLNAAGADINGVEVDCTAIVINNLTITSGLSIQRGRYTKFPDAPAYFNPPTDSINAAGSPTVHTPEYTASIAADYLVRRSFGAFDWNANFTKTASFEFFPDRTLQQPTTDIFNASVIWTHPSQRYDVRIWGANITGDRYYSFGSESQGLGKQFSPAPPATFGLTLGLHF